MTSDEAAETGCLILKKETGDTAAFMSWTNNWKYDSRLKLNRASEMSLLTENTWIKMLKYKLV